MTNDEPTVAFAGDHSFRRADSEYLSVGRRIAAIVVPNHLFADLAVADIDGAVANALLDPETDDAWVRGAYRYWWPSDYELDHQEKYPYALRDFHFRFSGEGTVDLVIATQKYEFRDDPVDWIADLVSPALDRRNGLLIDLHLPDDDPVRDSGSEEYYIHASLKATGTGARLLEICEDLQRLLAAADGGELSLSTAADLVRAGRGHLLEGQPESDWLDVKRAPYELSALAGKLELAKDVASFANADGGMLIIGARGEKDTNGERIQSFGTIPVDLLDVRQIRSILVDRVFPTIARLDVQLVTDTDSDRGAVMVHVPPQLASAQPFLVRGVDTGSKSSGVYFSVPTRHGDNTVWTSISTIHGLLTAGRLALRALDNDPPKPTERGNS